MIAIENKEKVIAALVKKVLTQCSKCFPLTDGSCATAPAAIPDNIAGGELGNIFILLEIFRKTQDEDIWASLEEKLTALENRCNDEPTNNYTYFFGRSGLVTLYLHLYEERGQELYLEKALELAKAFLESSSLKFTLLGSMCLYDGLGGILLVFLKLYSLTADENILKAIERFTNKIILSARLSREGIFWDNSHKNPNGFGFRFGASGIALVFLELGQFWGNDAFFELAKHALCCEDRYWSYDEHIWKPRPAGVNVVADSAGNGRPACWDAMDEHGTMVYVRMKYDSITGTDYFESKWKAGMEMLISKCFNEAFADDKETIEAVSNTGIVLQELAIYTGDTRISEAVVILTASVTRFLKLPCGWEYKNGLMNMPGAAVYFLARQMETGDRPASSVNFLFNEYESAFSGNIDIDSVLLASAGELFNMIAERNFTFSYPVLKSYAGGCFASFFAGTAKFTYGSIKRQFKKLAAQHPESNRAEYLLDRDIFMLEIHDGLDSSKHRVDEDAFIEEAVNVVTLTDDELLDTKFVFCDKIWIQRLKPEIDLSTVMEAEDMIEMLSGAEPALIICSYSPAGIVVAEQVKEDRLFLEQFVHPATCREIRDRIMQFIELQQEEIKTLMRLRFEVTNDAFLEKSITRALCSVVRYFFGEGIFRRTELA